LRCIFTICGFTQKKLTLHQIVKSIGHILTPSFVKKAHPEIITSYLDEAIWRERIAHDDCIQLAPFFPQAGLLGSKGMDQLFVVTMPALAKHNGKRRSVNRFFHKYL